MNILRISVYGLLLGVLLGFLPRAEAQEEKNVCYPTENGIVCFDRAVPGAHYDCQYLDDLWKSWRKGTFFMMGDYSTSFIYELKQGCPKGAGSIDYLAKKFEEHQEKEKKALKDTRKTVEAIKQRSTCRRGMWGIPCD